MNSMLYMTLDECDLAYIVIMIVLIWCVLLCVPLWLYGRCEYGPDMNYMIEEDERTWNDLSEWLEYMNVLWWLTWMIEIHIYVVFFINDRDTCICYKLLER